MQPQNSYPSSGQWQTPPNPYGQIPVELPKKGLNRLILPLVVFLVLFVAASAFGVWAYSERTVYKTESDKLSAQAVATATAEVEARKDAEYAEKEKQPLKSYKGPAAFGTVSFKYPRTWSAYISDDTNNGSIPVNGYLNPDYVPTVDDAHFYALRIQVLAASYDTELRKFDADIKAGKVKVVPFKPEKVPTATVGARVTGQLESKKTGVMVIVPLRDKTLKIWTESDKFISDYEKLLTELVFIP